MKEKNAFVHIAMTVDTANAEKCGQKKEQLFCLSVKRCIWPAAYEKPAAPCAASFV